MKITVLGCGNAFSKKNGNQMFMLEENGKKLLIDYGRLAPETLERNKINVSDIDAVYISHQHGDHIGALEDLAFQRYDWMTKPKKSKDFKVGKAPVLYAEENLLSDLWDHSLRGGLESMEGFVADINTFFDARPVVCNEGFFWEGWHCQPVQQVHVMTGSKIMSSYGLLITKEGHDSVYFTTDSQHCSPSQVETYYNADIIFQDCEIAPYMSGVHANYIELAGYDEANARKLSEIVKGKMWLSHYQDFYNDKKKQVVKSPTYPFYEAPKDQKEFMGYVDFDWDVKAKIDGFAGFVKPGMEFLV